MRLVLVSSVFVDCGRARFVPRAADLLSVAGAFKWTNRRPRDRPGLSGDLSAVAKLRQIRYRREFAARATRPKSRIALPRRRFHLYPFQVRSTLIAGAVCGS